MVAGAGGETATGVAGARCVFTGAAAGAGGGGAGGAGGSTGAVTGAGVAGAVGAWGAAAAVASIWNSTRLFFSCPAGVRLLATGTLSPMPTAWSRSAATPSFTSESFTALARFWEISIFA